MWILHLRDAFWFKKYEKIQGDTTPRVSHTLEQVKMKKGGKEEMTPFLSKYKNLHFKGQFCQIFPGQGISNFQLR